MGLPRRYAPRNDRKRCGNDIKRSGNDIKGSGADESAPYKELKTVVDRRKIWKKNF